MRLRFSEVFTNFVGFLLRFRERNREIIQRSSGFCGESVEIGTSAPQQKKPSGLCRRARGELVIGCVEEGHDLCAGAGGGGAEGGGRGAGGDAVLHRPEDGLVEEVAGVHVGEGIDGGLGLGGASGRPQEEDHLIAGADVACAELGVRDAGSDSVLHRPVDGLVVPGTGGDIG